jgi:NADPH:quinone reductase-like Zn-dependent oxidoreductase
MGLVAAGGIQPLVADQLPFEDAPAGLARLASGAVVGRLTVAPPG